MATQKGIGVVWGIGTTELSAGTGKLKPVSESYGADKEFIEHRDTEGEYLGCTSFAGTKTLELEFYPAGSTLAFATNAAINVPLPGVVVSLTDSADSDINGDWICVSFTKRKTNTDKLVGTLSLKRWNGIGNYTTISS